MHKQVNELTEPSVHHMLIRFVIIIHDILIILLGIFPEFTTGFLRHTHTIHATGIFTYMYHKNQPNVGKYTIHGWYGIYDFKLFSD